MTVASPRRAAAVVGDPARHSRSPAIHNAAFAAAGIDWVFIALEAPAGGGAAALEAMRVLGLGGLSVTMPLKAEVAAAADCPDEEVRILAAANCIVPLADGRLRAANTDIAGFIAGLATDAGISPEGRRVALVGAGGAARAVAWGAAAAGASDVAVINRTRDRAEAAAAVANAAASGAAVARVGTSEDIAKADLVVNATSLGMSGDPSMPTQPERLRPGQIAVDLVYEPLETPWLAGLRQRGVEAHNGLSMLVHQAAVAFELWTGTPAPLDVMREAASKPR